MTQRMTIGTDPELIFTDPQGNLLKASSYLKKTGKFGLDGHPWIAELRPDHAVYPRDLVENIRKALSLEAENLKNLVWLSGPWLKDKPMGFHIHFGVAVEERFVEALDNQLGFFLALSEPEAEARTRRTTQFPGSHDPHPYGILGDIRKKPYGFEYRTPSSCLPSPGVTLATLTVAKAIVFEELERGKSAWSQLPVLSREELLVNKDDFHACNKKAFKSRFDAYWKIIRAMKYFQKGMEGHDLWSAVAYFKSQIFPLNGFRVGHDIKQQWGLGLPPKKDTVIKSTKTAILLDTDFWGGNMKLIKSKIPKDLLPKLMGANDLWKLLGKPI